MVNTDTYTGASFSFGNRVARLTWNLFAALLFKYSPRPLHSWRAFLLRRFGAKLGKGVHIYPKVKIWAPWNLEVGDESGIADGAIMYKKGKITIGKRVVISQGAHLCSGTHDYTRAGFPLVTKPITIGNEVWVAADSFIHPGVNIGDGAVIGARSVVNRSMPAWKVCTGHPCQPLKDRVIEKTN